MIKRNEIRQIKDKAIEHLVKGTLMNQVVS